MHVCTAGVAGQGGRKGRRRTCLQDRLRARTNAPCAALPCTRHLLICLPPLPSRRPCLQFRGDADDRMLPEAVAPLLEQLHGSADVSAPLARRFDMQKWFAAQGLAPPVRALALPRTASVPQIKALAPPAPAPRAPAVSRLAADASATELLRQSATAGTLLVTDFDHTLTAW